MPTRHVIDRSERLVRSRVWGVFSIDDFVENANALVSDVAFDPSFDQLADLSEVTGVGVSGEQIRSIAHKDPFAPGSRRALVAPGNLAYGLSRMYMAYTEGQGAEVSVFRDRQAAERWLSRSGPGSR